MSDKLRVAMSTLRRLQDGDQNYIDSLEMHREMCKGLRQSLSKLESEQGRSEILVAALESIPSLMATLTSANLKTATEVKNLEKQVVQRCFQFAENLLRQAITRQARAYDPDVVNKHATTLLELAVIIQQSYHPMNHRKEIGHE